MLFGDAPDWPSRDAAISSDGLYRYRLGRRWGEGQACNFVMLNPSTADASLDDPTIRRCVGFAKGWGYPALVVTNLFGWRATDPKALLSAPDPIGPDNDRHLAEVALAAGLVVCAWGSHGTLKARGITVLRMLDALGVAPHYLAWTSGGQPRHPLYLKADLRPVAFGVKR
jgi:hypothetical protein